MSFIERRNKMFKKRVLLTALIMILTMALIAGCGTGSKKAANQLLQDSFIKASEIKSASIDGVIELDLELSNDLLDALAPDEKMILESIKNAKISYKGNYQLDPIQYELTFSVDIPFDGMKMQFDVPMLMTADKAWIKIPSLPVPGMDQFAGKFLELDFNQLAELSGETVPTMGENIQAYTKLSNDITPVFFKHFEESYFSKVDVKNLTLTNNAVAKEAVEFKITQEQLKPLITTFVEKVLPDMLEIMSKEEYAKLLGLTPEMVAEAKQELTVTPAELDEVLADIEKVLSNLTVSAIFAIDKDGFMPQQSISITGTITAPDEPGTVKFNLKMVANSSKINEKVTFENSFPPSPVIPFEELMYMGMGMGFEDEFGDMDWSEEDFTSDFDAEVFALHEELFAQPWFIANEELIDELANNDMEFYFDLMDAEVLRSLIDDAEYRVEFFAYYGVELVE